ncbi:GyrI-like domain-containing protein [Alkalimonas collagenimarina]|uniref:GyrI-like domain-containing protein n=1 Tax=Alkalimonas collagenimarina TaxID=400390 RepID=A0ABT9H3C2_9GAMM|nr:GyrI-like domain-containing protein [Alkalimonas collagenimarina]MDP4537787.1 GyrI-like domain-containing protein [Alkalimonas collagenimarina]
MELVKVVAKEIQGLSIRTNNADEMKPATAKIGLLWQEFHDEFAAILSDDATVYGVYFDYESDASGDFSVVAGSDMFKDWEGVSLQPVHIEAGTYLMFSAQGALPEVVIDVWQQIWAYFSAEDCPHRRMYRTDFERYPGPDKVQVYIGVQ